MTTLLKASNIIEDEIPRLTKLCAKMQRKPTMKVVLVGDNSASKVYVGHKKKLCEKIGAKCIIEELDSSISSANFLKVIKEINKDDTVDGVIIQLPLPSHLMDLDVYNLVKKEKDIDGFHFENMKEVYFGNETGKSLIPCTPKGILKTLEYYQVDLEGKHVVVLGRSQIVGKPMSLLALNRNATVTTCHSKTQNIKSICQKSDVIIAAIGKAEFIDDSFINESGEQVIIDVGIHKKDNGKLCGDVNFDLVMSKKPKAITPVPGGVGPMTVYSLIENLIIAAKRNQ